MGNYAQIHSQRPRIIAHRGASHEAPENTMAAFRLAAEMGADGIQLDVQLCKDGEAVIIHNFSVNQTTSGHGRVKDLILVELQKLDAGTWYSAKYAGERIPTLDQVLHELGPRLMLNIELKKAEPFSDKLEAEVVRLVEDTNMSHRAIISSLDPLSLWRIRRLNSNVSIGLIYSPDQPFFLRRRWLQPLIRPNSLHPRWDMIDEELVAAMHRQGLTVQAWVCNQPHAMRRLIQWNIDAIITDRPDRLYDLVHSQATQP